MATGSANNAQESVLCCQARREGKATRTGDARRFQTHQAFFECRASGIAAAGVFISVAQTTHTVLGKGGHLVDRGHHRTG